MITLTINVDPGMLRTTAYGSGALVRVERSATGGGTGYAEIGTAPLVAGGMTITYDDQTGTSTSWYRYRYSNAVNSLQSDYGAEFQAAGLTAYASVSDFLATYEIPPSSTREARISTALAEAASMLDSAIGWDFYRHPAVSGTEVRLYDGDGSRQLCLHEGVVSLTKVEVRWSAVDPTWQTVPTTDYYFNPNIPLPGSSFDHLMLTGLGTWSNWPPEVLTIRLTGVFGHLTPPVRMQRANIALARQIYRADATTPGGMAGPDEWGGGAMPRGWPDDAYRAVDYYRRLYWCRV